MTGSRLPAGRLGYLGPAGTFSHEALAALAPEVDALVPIGSVSRALDSVRSGEVAAALVPIENSVEGAVSTTLDELAAGADLQIVAEIAIPVRFCLAAREGAVLADVRTVVTHPHAQAQTRAWLAHALPDADVVPAASTAAAAVAVAQGEFDAAVCAARAADEYGLEVLAADIADNRDAETRFILVSLPCDPPPPSGADKTTLELFMRADHPGALLEILTEFAVRGVNLTRIESRPTKTILGNYYFSVDCEGHVADDRVGEALMGLHRICGDVRYRGSYARHDGRSPIMREGTSNADFAAARKWLDQIQ
ncbi:MAG: prephenate dehydratase [Candidatus Nanopelagicales bacterium]